MFLNGMYYTTSSTCRCQNGRYCMCSCSQALPVLQLHCSKLDKCPKSILYKLNIISLNKQNYTVLSWGVLFHHDQSNKTFFFCRYLSVNGFVINIDTLMQMIPELLQVQRYVLTYRFSQDHLELLFNSIRASGRVDVILITINSENILN